MGVNKVILVGNLGKDPELRYTPDRTAVCTFSLATGERKKDASGNWVDHTEWHRIVSFGKTAELCNSYLKKGRQVFIEGRIRTNKWQDKEGKDRYTTEIVAGTVQFLGSRDGGGGMTASDRGQPAQEHEVMESLQTADTLDASAPADVAGFDDDDIPF